MSKRPMISKVALVISFVMVCLPPLSLADEITIKDGSQAEGDVRELSEKRLILVDGSVGKVYWLRNVETIKIGNDDTGNIITYRVESEADPDDIALSAPGYEIPPLNYEPSVVHSAVSGCEIRLGSGKTVKYFGIDIPEDVLATAYNRILVEGKNVDVHVMEGGGAVVICDGEFVNAKLVEKGMARAGKEIDDVKLEALFSALQDYARVLRKGRWGLDREAGRGFISNYLSPGELKKNDIFAYVTRGETLQEVSWKKVPPRPPGISFSSLRNCIVVVGGAGPKVTKRRVSKKPAAAKKPASAEAAARAKSTGSGKAAGSAKSTGTAKGATSVRSGASSSAKK